MAFTAAEKLSISKIVGVTPTLVDAQLTALGTLVTDDLEMAVRTELDRWDLVGTDFVRTEAKEANFGAVIDPLLDQTDIRRNIAVLLELPYATAFSATSGMGTIQIA